MYPTQNVSTQNVSTPNEFTPSELNLFDIYLYRTAWWRETGFTLTPGDSFLSQKSILALQKVYPTSSEQDHVYKV